MYQTNEIITFKKQTDMKFLEKKSDIKSSLLKKEDCAYKGFRIGFDKEENQYFRGSLFNEGVDYFETLAELKFYLVR